MELRYLFHGTLIFLLTILNNGNVNACQATADDILKYINHEYAVLYDKATDIKWQNEINATKDVQAAENAEKDILYFRQNITSKLADLKNLNLTDADLKRQIALVPDLGYEVLPKEDFTTILAVISNMSDIFQKVKMCAYDQRNRCNVTFYPELTNIISTTDKEEEIKYYWLEWRQKAGAAVHSNFKTFVDSYRKASEMNNYSQPSDFWFRDYDESGIAVVQNLEKCMSDLKPLFDQAHAYVRGRLRKKYGPKLIEYNRPIPQHVLDPFLSSAILASESVDQPFKTVNKLNIAESLLRVNASAKDLFVWTNEFFKQLGMPELDTSLWWNNSEPKGDLVNDIDTTHKAWKFYQTHRIKFTYNPIVSESSFVNMFQTFADIHNYQAYNKLVTLYQKEPMPGFSSALSQFFSLAAMSPKHLNELNLVDKDYGKKEARINRLYVTGLQNIFIIPVLYLIERHRLDVLDNRTSIDDNCAYWRLYEDLYGVQPPLPRSNSDFDAAAKLILNIDEQFTKEIYAVILHFQMFEYFCQLTGQYVKGDPRKPLDLCDLRGHKIVGEKIYQAMSLGSSVDFKQILKLLVNSEKLSIKGFLEYYSPLLKWLKSENKRKNFEVGWKHVNMCQK